MHEETWWDAAVVGGGLGGLAVAADLARRGVSVVVLERSRRCGGRARTTEVEGFRLNLGPHALYRRAAAGLAALGVDAAGVAPPTGGLADRGGQLVALPVTPMAIVRSPVLRGAERWIAARELARLAWIDPEPLQGVSVRAWVASREVPPVVEEMLQAALRVSTYTDAPGRASAGAGLAQLREALRGGVRYLDGGWQRLVSGLRDVAVGAGARIETGAAVERVAPIAGGWALHTAAARLRARQVLVAGSPALAARVLPSSHAARWQRDSVPVRAACLDLALSSLPRSDQRFALGLDRPTYLSVHAPGADLAPVGGAVIHVAKYLDPDAPTDPDAVRAELEALADRCQPGWRAACVHRRFLPALTVANALPRADRGGLRGRPAGPVPDADGAWVVGDWVGPTGLLADAVVASAATAAAGVAAALGDRRQQVAG